ncbi:MAG TPA: potassium transporter TrkG [Gammaproteobacteria bacterium]
MTSSQSSLSYAVRLPTVAKYVGQLLILQAILTVAPLLVAAFYGEFNIALRYFIIILVILALALPAIRLQAQEHIQINEALAVVALAFILSPLLMWYPMSAAGLPALDTLFEAISAVTTTGLTTFVNIEDKPRSFLFARSWMQWYGGLGIVVLSIALLMKHHLAARRLTETTTSENLVTTARTYARRMLGVYLALTLLGFLLLFALSTDGFVALTHALSAISTGGFSTYTSSLAGFENPAMPYAVIGLAILGAIPLTLYYLLAFGKWRSAIGDIELRTLFIFGFISSALLGFFIYPGTDWRLADVAGHALLLGFSAQTTAGFSSLDIALLSDPAKAVLMGSMFVGGGVGSTAGGVKLLRLLILLRLIQLLLQRSAMPNHAVSESRLGGKILDADEIQRALLVILLFIGTILVSWFVFLARGYPALDSLFEVISATGTVGLSTGITHSDLDPVLKVVLCADMLLGRLEIVALLVVLYPPTWFGKRMKS